MTDTMKGTSEVSQRLARIEEVLAHQSNQNEALKRRCIAAEERCGRLENNVSYLLAMTELVRKECSETK